MFHVLRSSLHQKKKRYTNKRYQRGQDSISHFSMFIHDNAKIELKFVSLSGQEKDFANSE